jgi:hypothetical protein
VVGQQFFALICHLLTAGLVLAMTSVVGQHHTQQPAAAPAQRAAVGSATECGLSAVFW